MYSRTTIDSHIEELIIHEIKEGINHYLKFINDKGNPITDVIYLRMARFEHRLVLLLRGWYK